MIPLYKPFCVSRKGFVFVASFASFSESLVDVHQQGFCKDDYIVIALPKRRQLHGDDGKPIKQVFAKFAVFNCFGEILVGGRDNADVDLDVLFTAHRPEDSTTGTFLWWRLEGTQELGLHVEIALADLIEKQRATVGELKCTFAILFCTL